MNNPCFNDYCKMDPNLAFICLIRYKLIRKELRKLFSLAKHLFNTLLFVWYSVIILYMVMAYRKNYKKQPNRHLVQLFLVMLFLTLHAMASFTSIKQIILVILLKNQLIPFQIMLSLVYTFMIITSLISPNNCNPQRVENRNY